MIRCDSLFHCDFYAFLANLGDYDRTGLCGEGCCAVDGGGGAEGLAVNAIEADCSVSLYSFKAIAGICRVVYSMSASKKAFSSVVGTFSV